MSGRPRPSPLAQRLGNLLQQQRQHHGYTQVQLAERAELSLKYLGEVERGEANATVHALERIAIALDWDPWELFNTDPAPMSAAVHSVLLKELVNVLGGLQRVLDWLKALDPSTRPMSRSRSGPGRTEL